MASHGSYQHGVIKPWKDCQLMLPIPGLKQGNLRVPTPSVRTKPLDKQWKLIAPVLAEQGARHEQVIESLMSGIRGSDRDCLDLSLLSELVEFQATITDLHRHQADTDSPRFDLCVEMEPPFVQPSDITLKSIDDFPLHQAILINPDGKISFLGSANEMKDLLSLLAEFYFPNGSARQRMLVPQFKWVGKVETQVFVNDDSSTRQRLKVAPLMSLKKAKSGSTQRRKAKKRANRERNLYQNNYYSACASFLGLMMDKNHDGRAAIKSFKRTGPELHKLLLELSSTISGAGATVLLSVLCSLAYGRVQFDASNFMTTSVGLGLFWLSWAVYKLRETIVYIKKSPANLSSEQVEEMGRKLDKSVNGIYRAAAFTAVAVLSLP